MGVVAKVISGSFGKIIARQKSSYSIELGELLVSESNGQKIILQVYDLVYGSQLSQSALELASGLSLEENPELEFMDFGMRNYTLALLKGVLTVINRRPRVPKTLPSFFSDLRQIKEEDLPFFSQPKSPIFLGKLRSGTKVLNIDVFVDADKALSHHILVSAQTGKGKSNLVKVLLYKAMGRCEAGFLVLDPHDEYYGRHSLGLKDHPRAGDKLVYYTPGKVPVGCRELVFHIGLLKPEHLEGAVQLSDAQWQAVAAYYRTYKENWVEAIMLEKDIKVGFLEATINVVKRRLMQLLDLRVVEGKVECKGIFSTSAGRSTIADICKEVEAGKVVIVDTSLFSKSVEVLVGSLISTELFK
ncbi:DUF87 domain-containing protein, partial [Candidatus Woesearchaeota archaeon]|nr:DUF87 domain-containing protein [Candidatus Woesearchaeota archaeon]